MIPLYLGIEEDKISKSVNTNTDKVIVFNHRTKEYRGWKNFIKIIQELRKQRQDFKVFCSMIDPSGQALVKKAFDLSGLGNCEDFIQYQPSEIRPNEIKTSYLNPSKAKTDLNWENKYN